MIKYEPKTPVLLLDGTPAVFADYVDMVEGEFQSNPDCIVTTIETIAGTCPILTMSHKAKAVYATIISYEDIKEATTWADMPGLLREVYHEK